MKNYHAEVLDVSLKQKKMGGLMPESQNIWEWIEMKFCGSSRLQVLPRYSRI